MLNTIAIMGRLCADPDHRTTTGGTEITYFTVAVDRNFVPKGEQRKADFFKCVAWRDKGVFVANNFTKGKMIALVGSMQSREYVDVKGVKRTAWEIIVDQASFCGDRAETPKTDAPAVDVIDDDDLPWN